MTLHGDDKLDELAGVLRILGHPVRLRIVARLARNELCVSDIEKLCEVPQPGLSQQLGFLRKAKLVETRREGKLVFYRLDLQKIDEICSALGWLNAAKDEALPQAQSIATRRQKLGLGATFAKILD